MLRKVTLALVAAASLSAMALAPTAASAKPWGGGWGGGWGGYHHPYGHGFGIGFIGGGVGGGWMGCLSSPLRPRFWHRLHRRRRRRRLLRDPPGDDPVRLSLSHRQRLRLL